MNLDFTARSPSAAHWNFMRTPPDNGPVALADGTVALYLAGPFTGANSGAVNQTVPFSVRQLTRFRVTVSVRTQGTTGRGASAYAYGKVGGQVQGYVEAGNLTGDNDWQELSFYFVGDHRMDSVRLGCFLEGEGEAWFKDFTWEPVPLDTAPVSPEVRHYLDTFFQLVQEEVLYGESMDWPALRRDVDILVAGAQTTEETHAALNYLLRRINPHSFLIAPQAAQQWLGTSDPETSDQPRAIEVAQGRRINDKIAYLTVPHLGSGHGPTLTYYADTMQALIRQLDTRKTTGWIIDLRSNDGGNCWPMLAGIGPLLGEGIAGYFMAPDGSNAQAWRYENGVSYQDEAPQTSVSGQPYTMKKNQPRVAVLLGPMTTSSGEIIATAFRGRPRARSFGQPTGGYSTTNQNFYLSDGAIVLLTVSVYADRNRQVIPLSVPPDVVIEPAPAADNTLAAAVRWLQEQ